MREILFRGKRVDNGEWVQGFYVCKKRPYFKDKGVNLEHIICDNVEVEDNDYKQFVNTIMTTYVVDPETIGQYTGLTDMNGNKIFEGDIVREFGGETYQGCYEIDNVLIVKIPDMLLNFVTGYDCEREIIGNIHDNPELLKTDKEK